MRVAAALLCSLASLARAEAAGAPILVDHAARVTAGSWEPLPAAELGRVTAAAALEVLSGPGLFVFRAAGAEGPPAACRLVVGGHLLGEAATHTVVLTLGPGARDDLPTWNVAETVELRGLGRAELVRALESGARTAATRLLALARPALEGGGGSAEPDPARIGWPWRWGAVRVPPAPAGPGADALAGKDEGRAQAALRALAARARHDDAPRHALERCVLGHPSAERRRECLAALRPLALSREPSQRVVLEAYRRDRDPRLRAEASDLMRHFEGHLASEAVQAWLESAATGRGIGALADLGDVPNLDAAIRGCLEATGRARGHDFARRFECLELLGPLGYARRRAVLWRFIAELDAASPFHLEGAGERESSVGTPWERALDALLESLPAWDPALEDVLWERHRRTLSSAALGALSDWAAPSSRLVGRLLELVQTAGAPRALRALERIARTEPSLAPAIRDRLSELLALGTYPKTIRTDDLESAIRAAGGAR